MKADPRAEALNGGALELSFTARSKTGLLPTLEGGAISFRVSGDFNGLAVPIPSD
jgi:hypothetical protein